MYTKNLVLTKLAQPSPAQPSTSQLHHQTTLEYAGEIRPVGRLAQALSLSVCAVTGEHEEGGLTM